MTTTPGISIPISLDSTALVTGATSGIGRATAIRLGVSGHRVVVAGRRSARAAEIAESIRAAGGRAESVTADLGDADQVLRLARTALEAGEGRVDVLINNAAAYPPGSGATADTAVEAVDAAFATSVRAPYLLMRELAPGMAERGRGAVVNLISTAASVGMPGLGLYGATKAALAQLTRAWAAEFGPKGVRVNAVSPGPTSTEGTARFGDFLLHLASQAPAGRVAAPEEIAAVIDFLVSDDASFVQGVVLPADGGRLAV
jgi:NAD(P)-dependent dehydrogenase (short-subunit alcohol dehydrogenase family)